MGLKRTRRGKAGDETRCDGRGRDGKEPEGKG